MQDDLRCGARILSRVVVSEIKVQNLLEVAQTMPAIPLKFRPCPPCNFDTVRPAKIRGVSSIGTAGGVHGLLVEIAVLDQMVARQNWKQLVQHLIKSRGARNMIRANPVQPDVERIKIRAGFHQCRVGINPVIRPDAGQPDLANAGGVCACGFHVQRNEAKVAFGGWCAHHIITAIDCQCGGAGRAQACGDGGVEQIRQVGAI